MSTTTSRILSAIFKQLKSRPTLESVGIERYRKLLEKSASAFKPDPFMQIKSVRIKTIDAQWLIPANHNRLRTILYVHGGGYIAGSMRSHRDIASRIAMASNAKVLIFNYRLAPEHPFPKGLTDVNTVYHWLIDTCPDTHHICLAGDSAGAGLCLALLSGLAIKNDPLPRCSVLISPWVDLECKNRSHIENREKDPMLSPTDLRRTARLYTDKVLSHPMVSPINGSFSGLSPVLIQTGEHEILIDDSKILAEKLKSDGVSVHLEIWKDMFHVWHYFARYLKEGRQAITTIGQFIKTHS